MGLLQQKRGGPNGLQKSPCSPQSANIYAVYLPYDLARSEALESNLLKTLARPTGLEPVFPP
jgi:hypothetical protein